MKKIKLIIDSNEMEIDGNINSITFGKGTKYEIVEVDGVSKKPESKGMKELKESYVEDILNNKPKSLEELMGLPKLDSFGLLIERPYKEDEEKPIDKLFDVDKNDTIHKKLAMRKR